MKIRQILNNNAVVVTNGKEEKVAFGPGIGFNKKKNDIVNIKQIEKLFVLGENDKLKQLLTQIPEEHFLISEEVITYAEKHIGTKLNEHIHTVLTDHISFAIDRVKEGIHVRNKILNEVKILYKKEFEVGLWAIKYIDEKMHISMSEDEAAFIALHVHTMKPQGNDLQETIRQTTIIKDMIQTIKRYTDIEIEENDIAYHRLITHLRYALSRINHYDIRTLDSEMLEMIKSKFSISYACAQKVSNELLMNHGFDLPEQELGYITLHIERLRRDHDV